MSLFSCNTCKAHEAHIKSLEGIIKQMRDERAPAVIYAPDVEEYHEPPTIQPVYVPTNELQREFTADELIAGHYE